MANEKTNLCVNCRHARWRWFALRCSHPLLVDPVTGRPVERCARLRAYGAKFYSFYDSKTATGIVEVYCGMRGKLFESKEAAYAP